MDLRRFSTGSRGWFGRMVGAVLLCTLLLGSCQISSPQGGSDPHRIVLGTTTKPRTLDPADSYESISGNLLYNLGDRLYNLKPNSTDLVPQLATALPTISPDGLTYKIPLRKDVRFQDGEAFDAKAMAFSLQRFIENKGSPASLLSKFISSITATDQYELTLKLKAPFAGFTQVLTFPGLCAISPKAYSIGKDKFNPKTFVGTGPYVLAEYGTDRIRLNPNPNYWGVKPKNSGFDIQIFGNSASLFNAIKTKAIDAAFQTLDPNQVAALQQSASKGDLTVIEGPGLGIHYLSVNIKSPPFDKPEIRQALAALIDRKLLAERVFLGQVSPLFSLIPALLPSSQPVFQERYGDGNLAKAAELIQKAGYSKTKPLKLDFWYRSNIGHNALAALIIKAIADERMDGLVQINLEGVESSTAYSNLDKGVYPIFMLDWSPDYIDPDGYIQPFLDCTDGSANEGCKDGESFYQGSFYYNDRANKLIAEARKTSDPKKRQKLYKDLQTILVTDVPFIPLWASKTYLFLQKNVQGGLLFPTSTIPFSLLEKN
jgi:peptide/nickel transport system substrate-binding protein